MNCTDKILSDLFAMQDIAYRDFNSSLIPNLDKSVFIGVRTPVLRYYAKEFFKNYPETTKEFMSKLPHRYFEEDQLHAFLIEQIKDYDECLQRLEAFLPYVDNWATCDSMNPKVLKRHLPELLGRVKIWISSPHEYTCRCGIGVLMRYFLDEYFDTEYPELVSSIRRDEYYVKMMVAWYFATALAKQYGSAMVYLKEKPLPRWTHNKTIQKAIESYRLNEFQKRCIKEMKL